MRRRVHTALALTILAGFLLTSCASGPGPSELSPGRGHGRDVRLFGMWHAITARIAGRPRLRADGTTSASLRFRRDGLLVVNGENCTGGPYFSTAAGRIYLRRPANTVCSSFGWYSSALAQRIANIVDNLAGHSPITYAVRGTALVVAADRYRVTLFRGPAPGPRSASGAPSSPGSGTGSARTSPPS